MSSTTTSPGAGRAPGPARRQNRSEFGIVALLAVLGLLVVYDASRLSTNIASTGSVGPKVVPYVVGGLLLLVAWGSRRRVASRALVHLWWPFVVKVVVLDKKRRFTKKKWK